MSYRVFVAAPFEDGAFVREHVHERLSAIFVEPTASWVHVAQGPEDFSRFSPEHLAEQALRNDHDIHRAHALLIIARPGAGGESFAEANYAHRLGKPVVWCGTRLILSAWRAGVHRVEDLDQALVVLARMRDRALGVPR